MDSLNAMPFLAAVSSLIAARRGWRLIRHTA